MSKDIRNELLKREPKQTTNFYYWFYRTVMKVVGKKYNPEFTVIDDINKEKGPCFVIFNHLSRIDHFYTNEICYPKKVNMLAGYNEFFRSHLAFAFKYNHVIPKKQYINDLPSTKKMMQLIKKGGSISFAPEGLATNDGMPRPIVPGTGHMLKHFGIPVYFVKLEGQYLQNNKVCLDIRTGKTYATLSKMFSSEDLKRLSADEIEDTINKAFKHDDYLWQKEKHILWNTNGRICERLDDLMYRCPQCDMMFKMEGKDNTLTCHNCGYTLSMDDYYDFKPVSNVNKVPFTPSEWCNEERIKIIKEIRKNPNYSYIEKVKIGHLPNDHYIKNKAYSEIVCEGVLTINHDGMHFECRENSKYDFDLTYKELYTVITEKDSASFQIYVKGEFTEVFPLERHSVYYMSQLIEEMHRLHVNYYKNFKWNDYMYKDAE